jgi:hypothetical protein
MPKSPHEVSLVLPHPVYLDALANGLDLLLEIMPDELAENAAVAQMLAEIRDTVGGIR